MPSGEGSSQTVRFPVQSCDPACTASPAAPTDQRIPSCPRFAAFPTVPVCRSRKPLASEPDRCAASPFRYVPVYASHYIDRRTVGVWDGRYQTRSPESLPRPSRRTRIGPRARSGRRTLANSARSDGPSGATAMGLAGRGVAGANSPASLEGRSRIGGRQRSVSAARVVPWKG